MSNRRDNYYPYHIHFDKLLDKDYYNPEFADCYHKHSEMAIIRTIDREPFAFYLTEEDKKYYPENELKAIEVVQKIAKQQCEYELAMKNPVKEEELAM